MRFNEADLPATTTELRYAVFRLARRLRCARAVDSLSDAQLAILGGLRAHGRHTLSRLAERERVTAPTMSAIVGGLVEMGLVVRIPDEDDRRRVHVEITPQGEDVVTETIRRRDELLAAMITDAGLDDSDLAVLREAAALLQRMADA